MGDNDRNNAFESNHKTRPPGLLSAGGVLDRIVAAKFTRLQDAKENQGATSDAPGDVRGRKSSQGSFLAALRRADRCNIIAEIKHRSPSKGVMRHEFDPVRIAEDYAEAGAAALSVLTEEDFFGGSLDHLRAIRRCLPQIPLLRKDFLFDSSQLFESVDAGADAVLLITAILADAKLAQLIQLSAELGLDSLAEVHTRLEMERAVAAGARIIGINNRDLRDFTVDLRTSLELARRAPKGATLVSESGISTGKDMSMLRSAGFNAFLIGEQFMRADDPGDALKRLLAESETVQADN